MTKDTQNINTSTQITVTNNDNATVTLEGELPVEALEKHRDTSVKKLAANVSIDGFRKGKVPEQILLKNIGEHAILQDMAERALSEHYPSLLVEHEIDAIGHPEVTITKLAANNPLGFKIVTAIMPEFDLPEYKKVAQRAVKEKSAAEPKVEKKEVETFIENILRQKHVSEGGKGDDKLPELTDEYVATLGDFKTVTDFKAKMKESLLLDKKRQHKESIRMALMEALLDATKVTLPDVIIDSELEKMMAQFKGDIERMGMKPEEYFEKIEKSEEDMRKEFRPDAAKRAKTQLILNKVAVAEKITPEAKEVEKEVEHIMSHHKDANKEAVTIYVTTMLTNEKVLQMLEDEG